MKPIQSFPVDENSDISEELRRTMRRWTTGVAVVSSFLNGRAHGMTVNSFTSISLTPPLVCITLANTTRTLNMVLEARLFAVSILGEGQAEISDRFAGKIAEEGNRFEGLDTFTLKNEAPLIANSSAYLNCVVVFTHELPSSTLIVGEVIAAAAGNPDPPLVYLNRAYHSLNRQDL